MSGERGGLLFFFSVSAGSHSCHYVPCIPSYFSGHEPHVTLERL